MNNLVRIGSCEQNTKMVQYPLTAIPISAKNSNTEKGKKKGIEEEITMSLIGDIAKGY